MGVSKPTFTYTETISRLPLVRTKLCLGNVHDKNQKEYFTLYKERQGKELIWTELYVLVIL